MAHRSLRDASDLQPVDVGDDPVVLEVESRGEPAARAGEDDDVALVVVVGGEEASCSSPTRSIDMALSRSGRFKVMTVVCGCG